MCSSHSRLRRRRSNWRLMCPKDLAIAQRSLSRTRNVLSTSQRTVYNTINLQMTVLYDNNAQLPSRAINPCWFLCLPASMILLHCSLRFGCSWTPRNQNLSGLAVVSALQRTRPACGLYRYVRRPSTLQIGISKRQRCRFDSADVIYPTRLSRQRTDDNASYH